MNGLSEQLARLIVKERNDSIQRSYEHRQLVRIAREGQQGRFTQWRRDVIQRVRGTASSKRTIIEPSESVLYMAEIFSLSTEELRRQEAKRLLYERIAQGNALAEIENRGRRFWRGKA